MKIKKITSTFRKFLSHLTLFDYLALILALGIILVLLLFFLRKTEWVEVDIKVAPNDIYFSDRVPPFWMAESISIGDAETDGLGRKMVEVKDVQIFERTEYKKSIFLRLKLRAIKDDRKKQYSFRSKPLGVGSPIEIKLSKAFLNGVVTSVDGTLSDHWEDKVVETRIVHESSAFPETIGIFSWEAEAIKVGDQMKDSQGRVLAEIIEKKVKPADKIVTTSDGRVLLREDPLKKDVTLVVKIRTLKQGDLNYYLGDLKVKVGTSILIALPEMDVWSEITRIIH